MDKAERRALLDNLVIPKECGVNWETMTGDDRVRICGQCNLKVHNLSAMNEKDAAAVVKRRQSERTCVYFLRKDDGSIVVDNCPEQLKAARNNLYSAVACGLLCLALGIHFSSFDLTSLYRSSNMGETLPPHLHPLDELRQLCDSHYSLLFALAIAHVITFVVSIGVFLAPINTERKRSARRNFVALLVAFGIPALIGIAGKLMINNYGGLGGG